MSSSTSALTIFEIITCIIIDIVYLLLYAYKRSVYNLISKAMLIIRGYTISCSSVACLTVPKCRPRYVPAGIFCMYPGMLAGLIVA